MSSQEDPSVPRICSRCGINLVPVTNVRMRSILCSECLTAQRSAQGKAARPHLSPPEGAVLTCEKCGIETPRTNNGQKYCLDCRHPGPKPVIMFKCLDCQTPTPKTPNRKYCDNCRKKRDADDARRYRKSRSPEQIAEKALRDKESKKIRWRKRYQTDEEFRRAHIDRVQIARRMDPDTAFFYVLLQSDPCSYCNENPAQTADHITPLSRGGRNHWENLTAACQKCNSSKHARTDLLGWLLEKRDRRVSPPLSAEA